MQKVTGQCSYSHKRKDAAQIAFGTRGSLSSVMNLASNLLYVVSMLFIVSRSDKKRRRATTWLNSVGNKMDVIE